MFGFGGSSNKSSSQSSSLDFGVNTSFSDSLSQALSRSQSGGQSTSQQSIFGADILQRLYGDAVSAAGQVDTGLFQGQTAQLYNAGTSILDRLGVGAGEDYLQSRLTDTSARDAQLGALKSGLGELFRDEINPAITSRAVAGGTLGGGRQGVAQGVAAGKLGQAYQQGAASIFASDQAQRDAAAGTLIGGRNQAAGVGASLIPSLLGTAQAGLGAPLSPYAALSSILGGPTVLTSAQSTQFGESSSESVARAISEALGFNYGTSQSTSSSKGKSFNFGVGA